MKIVKTWCENTEEGKDYLEYNGYQPIRRLTKDLWLVKKIGNKLDDVDPDNIMSIVLYKHVKIEN